MRVYEGEAVTLAAPDAVEVRLSDGRNPLFRMDVAGGNAVFRKLPAVRYWAVATGADGSVTSLGTVDVLPIHDPEEVSLRKEVDDLDRQIADVERTIQFQESNSNSGAFKARAQLGAIRKARSNAEARLGSYLRGGSPYL